jgi:hypothetical protein
MQIKFGAGRCIAAWVINRTLCTGKFQPVWKCHCELMPDQYTADTPACYSLKHSPMYGDKNEVWYVIIDEVSMSRHRWFWLKIWRNDRFSRLSQTTAAGYRVPTTSWVQLDTWVDSRCFSTSLSAPTHFLHSDNMVTLQVSLNRSVVFKRCNSLVWSTIWIKTGVLYMPMLLIWLRGSGAHRFKRFQPHRKFCRCAPREWWSNTYCDWHWWLQTRTGGVQICTGAVFVQYWCLY